jgi:hypothetical protein
MNAKHEQSSERKTLSETLLELDGGSAASTIEARTLADNALRRDRLRVRILTWVTIVFFLLSVIAIYGTFHLVTASIRPKIDESMDVMFKDKQITSTDLATLRLLQDLYIIQFKNNLVTSAAVATILVSAVCTVLLIMVTRRATLRKIQIILLVLSEQIDAMRQASRTNHSSGSGETPKPPNAE